MLSNNVIKVELKKKNVYAKVLIFEKKTKNKLFTYRTQAHDLLNASHH